MVVGVLAGYLSNVNFVMSVRHGRVLRKPWPKLVVEVYRGRIRVPEALRVVFCARGLAEAEAAEQ